MDGRRKGGREGEGGRERGRTVFLYNEMLVAVIENLLIHKWSVSDQVSY